MGRPLKAPPSRTEREKGRAPTFVIRESLGSPKLQALKEQSRLESSGISGMIAWR
jgi:hypothetical protein